MRSTASTAVALFALLLTAETLVAATPTTTAVSSSQNPTILGQPVTFTATVSGGSPTGGVTFYDGSTSLGSAPLSGSGTAEIFLDGFALAAGDHSITAAYSGDSVHESSTSQPLIQTVDRKPSETSVFSSPNPSLCGDSVAFQVRVSPNPVIGGFLGKPAGSVTLSRNGLFVADVALDEGCLNLSSCGTFTTSALTAGTHSFTADYPGSNIFAPSTTSFTHTVAMRDAIVWIASSPNPSTEGESVTMTGTMSYAAATGFIHFYDGGNSLGTATIAGGVASLSTSTLTPGSHSLTAAYSGDTCTAPVPSSAPVTHVVNPAAVVRARTRTSLTTSPNPSATGSPVTMRATVENRDSSAVPGPATTVTFYDGVYVLAIVPLADGSATFETTTLAPGSHSLTASYSGDADTEPSDSDTIRQIVTASRRRRSARS